MRHTILGRSPLLAIFVMATLGFAVGATAVVLNGMDAIVFRPLPFRAPNDLMILIRQREGDLFAMSPPFFRALAARSAGFLDGIALFRSDWFFLSGTDRPLRVDGAMVSGSLFSTLGVAAELGSVFDDHDDVPGGHRLVLISHRFWTARYGFRRDVLGEEMIVDGNTYSVIGVMPEGFDFPSSETELWVPMNVHKPENYDFARANLYHSVVRLTTDLPCDAAEEALNRSLVSISAENGEFTRRGDVGFVALSEQMRSLVRPGTGLHQDFFGNLRCAYLLALACASLLLATACANVTNLLLIRAQARKPAMAIQLAIGAPRRRILSHTGLDCAILIVGSSIVAALSSIYGSILIAQFSPVDLPFPRDAPSMGLIILVSSGLVTLCVLPPALVQVAWMLKIDPSESLKPGARDGERGTFGWVASGAVAIEFATAAFLGVGALMLGRSFLNLDDVDPGFSAREAVAVEPFFERQAFPVEPGRPMLLRDLESALGSIPGVTLVARTNALPLGHAGTRRFSVSRGGQARDGETQKRLLVITPGYLESLGIRVVDGRPFSRIDDEAAPPVAIVDSQTARQLWPGETALGKRVQLRTSLYEAPWRTIVGVTAPLRNFGLSDSPEDRSSGQFYFPMAQFEMHMPTTSLFILKARALPRDISRAVQSRFAELAPNVPINIFSLQDQVRRYDALPRFLLIVVTTLSALTSALGFLGSQTVLQFRVSGQDRDLGIRAALGATRERLWIVVLRMHGGWVIGGTLVGCLLAAATSRALNSMLFGVDPLGPGTYALVALILAGAGFLSCLGPGRRAVAVDPARLLRLT